MSTVADILLVSSDEKDVEVFNDICNEFQYKLAICKDFDALLEFNQDVSIIVLSHKVLPPGAKLAELTQGAKQTFPDAFQIVIISDGLAKEESTFLRKSGANLVALESEITQSSKFAFCLNQILRATYLPLKALDLVCTIPIPFTVFHLLPQRKKFVPIIHEGDTIDEKKFEKLKEVSEYYFHRTQASQFKKFIEQTADRAAQGLAKRCRANFVVLQSDFAQLVLALTDQSDQASFGEGQELVNKCRKLCEDLLANLAEFPKAWEIINSSAIGEFGSLERAPAIAAYCGLFGILTNLQRVPELMLVALLCDIGIIKTPAVISKKIRNQESLSSDEMELLRKVPEISLNTILDRKLSMDEKSRNHLLATYERADGTGYPKKISELKLYAEAQMVRLARDFDRATLLRLGVARKNPKEALRELVVSEKPGVVYTKKFIDLLNDTLMKSEVFS